MPLFDFLAESKIAEAISRGELDDLPGSGRPLELDGDPLVPQDLRVAYRILKNAGYVPPEVQALKKLSLLEIRIEGAYYRKALARLGRLRKV
jgi:DnaJ-like protein